ncbi:MAG: transposase, partial [Candidatus Uhrbacteria bacterium]|nr:transposase [Candidatus Uhrbacteria bacterium]
MKLTRTTKLKLKCSPEVFRATFEKVTQAYNYICGVGFSDKDCNSISLHSRTYAYCRETLGLPSELACQTRGKASESLKAAFKKKHKCPKSAGLSVRLTKNSFTLWFDRNECSVLTVDGRKKFSFHMPDCFKEYASWRRKGAELIERNGAVYLCVVWEKDVEDTNVVNNPHIVGVDRGVCKVAVCSDNTFFTGDTLRISNRYHRLRKQLQSKGTKSAK